VCGGGGGGGEGERRGSRGRGGGGGEICVYSLPEEHHASCLIVWGRIFQHRWVSLVVFYATGPNSADAAGVGSLYKYLTVFCVFVQV
jgi:hypothetical protein